jgi:multiple sugar transport system substrate-binding protein
MRKIVMILCVAVMLLTACGGGAGGSTPSVAPAPTAAPLAVPTQAPAGQERTTVRFAITDWELPLYEGLIKNFEEENPDLHLQVVSINEVLGLGPITNIQMPDDANQRLVAAADVVTIGVTRQTVEDGLVRDLTPFIQADAGFDAADFWSGTLESYEWNGGTWALPRNVTFRLIFYSKDAFDEAGVPYPQAGWTWDDLLAKAKALTVREGDEVTRWGFVVPRSLDYRLIESRVGTLVDEGSDPPLPRFDSADAIDAVRWYTDLHLKDQVMPYSEPPEEGAEAPALSEEEALIDNGQAAMWPDLALLWVYRNQQGHVGVVPFPQDTSGARTTPAWTDSVAMSAGTRQPQAAWRWMDFLTRQTVAGLGLGVNFLPARRSAAEAGGYWDSLDEALADALRYALDHGYVAREAVGGQAFGDAMNAIFSEEKTVEEALADAQAQAEAEIEEQVTTKTGATPVPTFVVAPPEKETPASEGAVTITFVPGLGSFNLEPYRALADRFHEAHPDVVVDVKMLDIMSGTVPDLPALGRTADCFQWYAGFDDEKNREAILNLQPLLDADPSFTMDDFYPQAVREYTWQGQLWGLPADVTPYVIEYNKDLFDAAGLDYPALDWTADDFLAAAVALTKGEDEAKQYGYVAEAYELNDLLFMIERLGAKVVDDKADPPALSYNDPDTVDAVRWYANLTTEYKVKPVFLTDITNLAGVATASQEHEALINGGRAGMWTSSGAVAAIYGQRSGLNIGVAPLPGGAKAAGGGYAGASGYFISADTPNRQACWQWITFLTGQPAAVQGLPARRSVAESDEYRKQVGVDRAEAYLASVGSGDQPSAYAIFSEEAWLGGALYWLGQAYGQVVDGKASVEEALDTAQKLADDYRACVVAGGDYSQPAWQACVKATDPTLPDFLFPSSGG